MSSRSSLNQNNARRIRKFVAQSDWAVFKHSAFKFNPELEGYHDFVFGASAHDIRIHHLFHELGHAAEFGAENFHHRALPWGFRFSNPTVKIEGEECRIDPVSLQMTEREVRTIARQIHLTEASGYACVPRLVAKNYGSSLRWLPDHHNSPVQCELSLSAWSRWVTNRVLEEYLSIKQQDVESSLVAWLDETRKFQINY